MSKSALYFITEEDGRCRQVVNGVVTSLNKKKPIPSPIGTLEIIIFWERDMLRWATIRNFGLPLGFPLDGALILRNDYYKFNIDRKLFLLIKRYVCETDPVYYRSYYKQLYKGELDFSTFDDQKGESKVEMNIQEGGFLKLIKAQENTKFFLPFDEDAVNVFLDGVLLNMQQNWLGLTGFIFDETGFPFEIPFPMIKTTNDGTAPYVAFFDQQLERMDMSVFDYVSTSQNFFATVSSDSPDPVELTIEGLIKIQITTLRTVKTFRFTLWQVPLGSGATVPPLIRTILFTQLIAAANDPYEYTLNETVTAQPGDRFFFTLDRNPAASASTLSDYEIMEGTEIRVSFQTKNLGTVVKGFKEFDAFKKICLKIGIPEDKIVSTELQASTLVLTSGDGIRGLEDAGITTSFNDIVKNADVNHFTGVQIKDTLELEGRDNYFVQDSIDPAIELGESKDLKVSPAIDLMYSSIKVGWQEQSSNDVNDVNAKSDFNGFHIYTTPIKRVSREMDLQSHYKAGPFEIENLRLNLDGKITSGGSTDNDVFVLDCVLNANSVQNVLLSFIASGNYIVFPALPRIIVGASFSILGTANNNTTYTVTEVEDEGTTQTVHTDITITVSEPTVNAQLTFISGQVFLLDRSVVPDSGVPSPETIFNVRLRPSALFDKHKRWIASYLDGFEMESIEFQSANRNSGLVVGGLVDGRDRPVSSLGAKIFLPHYLEFTTRVPISLQDTLESSPNKTFANDWEDVRYVGFLWKAGLAPNSRQAQAYKLLLTEENDLESLIS